MAIIANQLLREYGNAVEYMPSVTLVESGRYNKRLSFECCCSTGGVCDIATARKYPRHR